MSFSKRRFLQGAGVALGAAPLWKPLTSWAQAEVRLAPGLPAPHFVDTNVIRMEVYDQGEGLPVVFVHGFHELAYSWRHQMLAYAAAGLRAIAPDMRGYGLTDRLGERVAEQPDLEVRTLDRQGRLQVAVCAEPQRRFSFTQHEGETPVQAGRDRLLLAFDTNVRNWYRRGAVDDDARDRCRFLSRGDRRPREQYPDQEQACEANDGEHSQKCTVRPTASSPTPVNR